MQPTSIAGAGKVADTSTPCEKALQYARDVIAGEIPCCKWIKLAAHRHIDDLAKVADEAYPYTFDEHKANRAVKFTQLFSHQKGRWAARGERLVWESWQLFILCNLFGWCRKKDGNRRYRRAYILVSRKNGKSVLAAAIGLYFLLADFEASPEVYAGASGEAQAYEVFRPAKQMLTKAINVKKKYKAFAGAKVITTGSNNGRFGVLIASPKDGQSPSLAIADEAHQHADDTLITAMLTGMGAREQPLLLCITTAGVSLESPAKHLQSEVEAVLEGNVEDESLFGMIYTIDAGDDPWCEESLLKSNPNAAVSVSLDFLREQQSLAAKSSRKQHAFLQKHLCVWVGANSSFFNMNDWARQGDAPPPESLIGCPCYIALDLASKIDLACRAKVFKKRIDGKDHYYGYVDSFTPEARLETVRVYQGWARDGHLQTTAGNAIDYQQIEEETVAEIAKYKALEVCADPWNSIQMLQNLGKLSRAVPVEFPQTVQMLSEPMKTFESLIADGRFHHDGNPCTRWQMSNVTAHYDAKDNVFPRKEQPENKIDACLALLMSLSRALVGSATKVMPNIRTL